MPRVHNPAPSALPDDVVLSVRGISKKFCRNLKRSMLYGMQDLGRNLLGLKARAGAEGPEAAAGSPASGGGLRRDEFWALSEVSFDVRRGEAVGLIGLNGSGKTTLLRLIHGIFPPDHGEIALRGRIGALIALGAGFHPHMTGRENVFLNGAILGIQQAEIRRRLADIVEFAEIGDFIDAPVSTYSSGMRVRLGFSVAAYMKPDVLLIDEVLAVGDLTFRNKCMSFMRQLQSDDTTILFVSHNTYQVSYLCDRAVLLDMGRVVRVGPVDEVIAEYNLRAMKRSPDVKRQVSEVRSVVHVGECDRVRYRAARILIDGVDVGGEVQAGAACTFRIEIEVDALIEDPWVILFMQAPPELMKVAFGGGQCRCRLTPGTNHVDFRIADMPLLPGNYVLASIITEHDRLKRLARCDDLLRFSVVPVAHGEKSTEVGFFQIKGELCHSATASRAPTAGGIG